jgi:hypothetical protein
MVGRHSDERQTGLRELLEILCHQLRTRLALGSLGCEVPRDIVDSLL